MKNTDNALKHLCPVLNRLFHGKIGKSSDLSSGQINLVVKGIRIELLFYRTETCHRRCPYLKSTLLDIIISELQFCFSPLVLGTNPLIHADSAVLEPVCHIPFLQKAVITVLGVVGCQGQVRHSMQPGFMDPLII